MWILEMPSEEEVEDELKKGLTPVGAAPLYCLSESEKDSFMALYDKYDRNNGKALPEFENSGLQNAVLDALLVAYKSTYGGGRLKDLRGRLLALADHCPLCGIGSVAELDHYLPKDKFKAFAIYARNLVPVCSICNGKKSNKSSYDPNAHFIQAYFDKFPDEEFLNARLVFNRSGMHVDFFINKTESMPDELYNRICHQMLLLDLPDRYQPEVNNFLCGLKTSFEANYIDTDEGATLKSYLVRLANDLDVQFGKNHWKTALVRGLLNSDEFCKGGFVKSIGTVRRGA